MTKASLIFVCVAFLILTATSLQAQDAQKDFSCSVVPTLADKELDRWYKVLPGARTVIPPVTEVSPRQPFNVLIFFRDFALDENNRADLAYSISIHKPDGSQHERLDYITGYRGPYDSSKRLILTKRIPTIYFDREDPQGDYTIRVRTFDRVSGKEATKIAILTLGSYTFEKTVSTDKDLERFFTGYYNAPRPNSLLYTYLVRAQVLEPGSTIGYNPQIVAFYRHALQGQRWQMPYVEAAWEEAEFVERRKLLLLMKVLGWEPYFVDDMEVSLDDYFAQAPDWQKIAPNETLESPTDIDIHLAEFFATGAYKPILTVAEAMEALPDISLIQQWKDGKLEQTDDNRAVVERAVNAEAARIALTENARMHKLIRHYLEYALVREPLPEAVTSGIGSILEELPSEDGTIKVNVKE